MQVSVKLVMRKERAQEIGNNERKNSVPMQVSVKLAMRKKRAQEIGNTVAAK